MPKHHNSRGEQRSSVNKRLSALESKVGEPTREMPVPAEQQASAQAARGREADVAQTMSRLGGQSRSDLASDADRGSGSPLGHGTGSVKRRK
jgi:hypothetical protein